MEQIGFHLPSFDLPLQDCNMVDSSNEDGSSSGTDDAVQYARPACPEAVKVKAACQILGLDANGQFTKTGLIQHSEIARK